MFVHLGKECVINMKDVIGIFDIDNTSVSKYTREYLFKHGKENKVFYVNEDLPKSFIVTKNKKDTVVYVSSISPKTLKKRWETNKLDI